MEQGEPVAEQVQGGAPVGEPGVRGTGLGFPGDVAPVADAAAAIGMPLHVIAINDPAVFRLYERQLVLVRPDGMVAWRGDCFPMTPPRWSRG